MDDLNRETNFLDRLIRGAYSGEKGDFQRPSEETISACLMGTAEDEQRIEFSAALLASETFRTEMRDLARQILEAEEVSLSQLAGDRPVRAVQNEDSSRPAYHDDLQKTQDNSNIIRLVWPVVAIAAAVLLMVYWPGKQKGPELARFASLDQPVDRSRLRVFSPRGANGKDEPELYATADSAAIGEFKYLLKYEDGEFSLAPPAERPRPSANTKKVVLKMFDESGKLLQQIEAEVPLSSGGKPLTQAWALTLPSLQIGAIDLDKDTVEVAWPSKSDNKACVTVTYRNDSGLYGSIMGFTLDLGGKY